MYNSPVSRDHVYLPRKRPLIRPWQGHLKELTNVYKSSVQNIRHLFTNLRNVILQLYIEFTDIQYGNIDDYGVLGGL